jgi:hypothetical protein
MFNACFASVIVFGWPELLFFQAKYTQTHTENFKVYIVQTKF